MNSPGMSSREISRLVEVYIGTNGGYLNNFTYAKHDKFYPLYCDLDIDASSYREQGHTTRTAFIQILKDSRPRDQAKIIKGVFEMLPPPDAAYNEITKQKLKTHAELLGVAARLEAGGEVATPALEETSEAVFEALRDAETLLQNRGPKSALDRAHTALHGYIKNICAQRQIVLPRDASLTALFKLLREHLPEFRQATIHDGEAKRVVGSIAAALDSLNTIRNRGSLAHPNELLLKAPEAMLYINLSRAVLGYLESKLGT
jgi:hypothetical protein